jgi:U3 small nucleolar RNA-associated protein 10
LPAVFTHCLKCTVLAFWRNEKLRQIAPLLVEQVSVCIRLEIPEGKTTLSGCLEALMEAVNDDTLIKSINLDLLMHTRSEDVRTRIFALTCSETLWRAHGGKLLGT